MQRERALLLFGVFSEHCHLLLKDRMDVTLFFLSLSAAIGVTAWKIDLYQN